MWAIIVDDDLEARADFLEAGYDFGFTQVVGHDAHLRLLVGNRVIEQFEDRVARLEPHPGERLGR